MYDVSPKRIGYLRMVPATVQTARTASGPVKSMWRKLHFDGLVNASATTEQKFWLTHQGKRALEQFDASLSEPCRAVLNAIKAGQSGAAAMKGMITVINAGLVHVGQGQGITYTLTEAGERLADPIGESGYFVKSGNRVEVQGVRIGDDGRALLEVVRLEGDSKGKGMSIPRDGFVRDADWPAYCEG